MNRLIFFAATFVLTVPALAARSIDFGPYALPDSGSLVVPIAESEGLTGLAAALDERTGGAIALAVAESQFNGEKDATLTLFGTRPYSRIDLIGIGADVVDRVAAENFGGIAASLNDGTSGTRVHILWHGINRTDDATAARVAFGHRLGDYRFDRYLEEPREVSALGDITILSDDADAEAQFDNDLAHLADAIYLARDLTSEPGNVIYPQSFVDRVASAFADTRNVRVRVLDEKELKKRNMGAHLGVGSGSARPPRLLVIEYFGAGDGAPVVLAGKGITFDTGGISIKPNEGMWRMKGDMGGAAVVVATVLAIAKRDAAVNVVALAALAENMPSGSAIRPGDILTSSSGKTIEISSTDAEGRLVLSDAVHYGQVEYSPPVLIDVATLTGSVTRAVGTDYAGLFSRHDDLAEQLLAAAAAAGEPAWRLPLNDSHFEQIKSDVADVINGGITAAGASIGAAFIGTFVDEDQPWAHFDIASVDNLETATPTIPIGYSAWGIRTLDEYLRRHHEAAR